MKKFLFSLTMLAAVALAGFTTSCADGGNDDNNDNNGGGGGPAQTSSTIYESSLNVKLGTPEEVAEGIAEDLGSITEDVKIDIKSSQKTLDLSIKGINLGRFENEAIPPTLKTPFDIELKNVPYTDSEGVYNIEFEPTLIDEEAESTDVVIKVGEFNAYLRSLKGNIEEGTLNLKIYVRGEENLAYAPVFITVTGIKK